MGSNDQGITNSLTRWQTIPRVLCFVLNPAQTHVLLLRGAPTKRIWANRLNGVGGHVEPDEDIKAAAIREIYEETGLEVAQLQLTGVVHINSGQPVGIIMFVWKAVALSINICPSPEGSLEWFAVDQLPTSDLVDDLAVLLPRVLDHAPHLDPFWSHYSYDATDTLQIVWHD